MRRAIATRLAESNREAPHFFVRGTARVDDLLAVRARLNAGDGPRITVTDLVVAAVARAHAALPEMNVVWTRDAVRRYATVDVGVAVATDRGLVTPVVRGVESRTVSSIARATADLTERARAGSLRQDELEGGTITVSNLGVLRYRGVHRRASTRRRRRSSRSARPARRPWSTATSSPWRPCCT